MTQGARASGDLFIVSAPSGAGKTSLVRKLVEIDSDIVLSVSHTTRALRRGEQSGVDYHFVSAVEFEALIAGGAFLEHAQVFDHLYGTTRESVYRELEAGRDVVLEIDWQGARQVRSQVRESVSVFVMPPSRQSLRERLCARGQDPEEIIGRRMRDAASEMAHYEEFEYLVVNERLERAVQALHCIVEAQRLKRTRQGREHHDMIDELLDS